VYLHFGHPLFYLAGYIDAMPGDGDNSQFCNHKALLPELKRGNNPLHASKR
jgi:hypothetical protein